MVLEIINGRFLTVATMVEVHVPFQSLLVLRNIHESTLRILNV